MSTATDAKATTERDKAIRQTMIDMQRAIRRLGKVCTDRELSQCSGLYEAELALGDVLVKIMIAGGYQKS